MTVRPRHGQERASTIGMSILVLAMISMMILFIGTQALNSRYVSKRKQDRSVGMAAGDSGIEKYRAALQQRLADESNGFILHEQALRALVQGQDGATVKKNAQTSGAAGMTDVSPRIPQTARFTVVERGSDSIGYWQLYDVLTPRYLHAPGQGRPATDLVVYIRAWATGPNGGNITTKPRLFRAEYRPGFFSDYQMVTNSPIFSEEANDFYVNGPVHTNGYLNVDWLAMDDNNVVHPGIYMHPSPTCGPKAKFSTSQKQPVDVAGASCAGAVNKARKSARQISLLGVEDTYRYMNRRCGTAIMQCISNDGPYRVRLLTNGLRVTGRTQSRDIGLVAGPDSGAAAVLLDDDVRLSGRLSTPGRAGRVTVATRRRAGAVRAPQVILSGIHGSVVGANDPGRESVGIITQGDIVLDHAPNPCLTNVNVAAISQSGAVTVTPELITVAPPVTRLDNRRCNKITLNGSFSAHGQMVTNIRWKDVRNGGFTPTVGYPTQRFRYNPNLFLNPPPFFPTATPWAMTKVKDADTACLTGPNAGDPRCE